MRFGWKEATKQQNSEAMKQWRNHFRERKASMVCLGGRGGNLIVMGWFLYSESNNRFRIQPHTTTTANHRSLLMVVNILMQIPQYGSHIYDNKNKIRTIIFRSHLLRKGRPLHNWEKTSLLCGTDRFWLMRNFLSKRSYSIKEILQCNWFSEWDERNCLSKKVTGLKISCDESYFKPKQRHDLGFVQILSKTNL